MKLPLLFLLGAASAFCQPFSFGVKAGVPVTDFVSTASKIQSNNFDIFHSNINRYILGVTGEVRLPFGLGVELDVLYRHLNYQNNSGSSGVTTINSVARTSAGAWEFPLLAKYRFPGQHVRPFVSAGVAWDTLTGLKQDVTSIVNGVVNTSSTSTPSELRHDTTRGFVMGAGLDVKVLVIHLVPEVRFTRWGARHFADPDFLLHSNQNQGEFLLGIQF